MLMVEKVLQSVDKVRDQVYSRARTLEGVPVDVFAQLVRTSHTAVLQQGFPRFARCFDKDLSLFFDDSETPVDYRTGERTARTSHLNVHPEAAEICASCPVLHLCARETLKNIRGYAFATMAGVKVPGIGKRYTYVEEALEERARWQNHSLKVLLPQLRLASVALVTAGPVLGYAAVQDDVTQSVFDFVREFFTQSAPDLIAT